MEELKIYAFQVKHIETALKLTARYEKCSKLETCYDRDVMQALQLIRNIIEGKPDERVNRFKKHEKE